MDMALQRQQLVDLARRIVLRQRRGQFEVAAELIVRALATSDADRTCALALALTEQALIAVEDDRVRAASQDLQWRPAMMDGDQMITADYADVAPVPLAMRMVEAMHRGMLGENEAVTELRNVYDIAAAADHQVFHGLFAALAAYAAYALNAEVQVFDEHREAACAHAPVVPPPAGADAGRDGAASSAP